MPATRKLQKFVIIITFPSHMPLNFHLLFISVSNARTRFIGSIRIKCFMTFCIQCNKCPWSARTRCVRWVRKRSKFIGARMYVSFKYLKNLINIFVFYFRSELQRSGQIGYQRLLFDRMRKLQWKSSYTILSAVSQYPS